MLLAREEIVLYFVLYFDDSDLTNLNGSNLLSIYSSNVKKYYQ